MNRHLAILKQLYLKYILQNKKLVDSRWYIHKLTPWVQISTNDLLYLKLSGGPIKAICRTSEIKYLEIQDEKHYFEVVEQYKTALCLTNDFIEEKRRSRYCILIWLKDVRPVIPEIRFEKHDQRSWLVNPPLPIDWQTKQEQYFFEIYPDLYKTEVDILQ